MNTNGLAETTLASLLEEIHVTWNHTWQEDLDHDASVKQIQDGS